MECLHTLAEQSEPGPGVTRVFASPEHAAAIRLIGAWMHDAGMEWHVDAVANVVGRYPAADPDAPVLIMGSHQDSVREGGAFDGAMGVILPIVCVQELHRNNVRLPFSIEIVAFSDEEGVRYETTLLGSKALAGTFDPAVLDKADADGIKMRDALIAFGCDPEGIAAIARDRSKVIGYLEAHIEQGPVLERRELPVGIVTSIVHGRRIRVNISGAAGHAGTVPMGARFDALCASSECVLAVERIAREMGHGFVGTVGILEAFPGAINVIPGQASFTMDLRSSTGEGLKALCGEVEEAIEGIAAARGVRISMQEIYRNNGCDMSPKLVETLRAAIERHDIEPHLLPSGAGHDAVAMHELCDVGMLFVRCAGGVSHNPAESVESDDLGVAAGVLLEAIRTMARHHGGERVQDMTANVDKVRLR
jgi:hydantoinase/carbamoylase family amidase